MFVFVFVALFGVCVLFNSVVIGNDLLHVVVCAISFVL